MDGLLEVIAFPFDLPRGYDKWGVLIMDPRRNSYVRYRWEENIGKELKVKNVRVNHAMSKPPARMAGPLLLVAYKEKDATPFYGVGGECIVTGKMYVMADYKYANSPLRTTIEREGGLICGYLEAVDCRRANLTSYTFDKCNFNSALMECSDISMASFINCSLVKTNLYGGTACDTTFENVDLRYANLSFVKMKGSKFVRCDLRGTNLRGTDLDDCSFEECDLTGVIDEPYVHFGE